MSCRSKLPSSLSSSNGNNNKPPLLPTYECIRAYIQQGMCVCVREYCAARAPRDQVINLYALDIVWLDLSDQTPSIYRSLPADNDDGDDDGIDCRHLFAAQPSGGEIC